MSKKEVTTNFGLHFGLLAKPLVKQLAEQDLRFKRKESAGIYQQMSESIALMRVAGVLTEAETDRARKRLINHIANKHVVRIKRRKPTH